MHNVAKSAGTYPGVKLDIEVSKTSLSLILIDLVRTLRMSSLSSSDGTFREISQSNRPALLREVSSTSGLLVVPRIITGFAVHSRSSIHEMS